MKIFIFLLVLYSSFANSATIDIGSSSNISTDANGNLTLANPVSGKTSLIYPDLIEQRPVTFPTSKGNLPTTIEQRAPVSLAGVASGIVAIAKATPYGKALVIAGILCNLTDICKDAVSGEWSQKVSPPPIGAPVSTYASQLDNYSQKFATLTTAEQYTCNTVAHPFNGDSQQSATVWTVFCGVFGYAIHVIQTCPTDYHVSGSQCLLNADVLPSYRSPTASDWDTAQSKLAVQSAVQPFVNTGEPVPVTTPTIQPMTKLIGQSTSNYNDANGNPITETKTTQLSVTPAPTPQKPYQVITNETVTTNITNNTTHITQTTVTNNGGSTVTEPAPLDTTDLAKEATLKSIESKLTPTGTINQKPITDGTTGNIFYEPKYPNGISGIWNQAKADISASSLGQLTRNLSPNLGDGGAPPSWTFHFNIGSNMNFGSHTLATSSEFWSILSIFAIITSLFMARKLVFGG